MKISKYMYDRLRELGVPVTLTRDADVTLTPMERVNRILSAYGDDSNVIVISNHLNAGGGEFTYRYIIWLGIKTAVFEWFI